MFKRRCFKGSLFCYQLARIYIHKCHIKKDNIYFTQFLVILCKSIEIERSFFNVKSIKYRELGILIDLLQCYNAIKMNFMYEQSIALVIFLNRSVFKYDFAVKTLIFFS